MGSEAARGWCGSAAAGRAGRSVGLAGTSWHSGPLVLCAPSPPAGRESHALERLDLAAELRALRAPEKERLVERGDRLATYAGRVRDLARRRRALRLELPRLVEQEARGLRALPEAERARLRAEGQRLRHTHAPESLCRVRREIGRHGPGAAGSLGAELAFLHKLLAEERAEQDAAKRAVPGSPRPDPAAPLRYSRAQYERLEAQNKRAPEDRYRSPVASVAELGHRKQEAVRTIRLKTGEYRRLLQSRSADVEASRAAIALLTKQLASLEGTRGAEVARCQERVAELEQAISEAKEEMTQYLQGYQELLNVRMALDMEIAAYRKLLEGEEMWWSSLQRMLK